jgi:hypothetical protein
VLDVATGGLLSPRLRVAARLHGAARLFLPGGSSVLGRSPAGAPSLAGAGVLAAAALVHLAGASGPALRRPAPWERASPGRLLPGGLFGPVIGPIAGGAARPRVNSLLLPGVLALHGCLSSLRVPAQTCPTGGPLGPLAVLPAGRSGTLTPGLRGRTPRLALALALAPLTLALWLGLALGPSRALAPSPGLPPVHGLSTLLLGSVRVGPPTDAGVGQRSRLGRRPAPLARVVTPIGPPPAGRPSVPLAPAVLSARSASAAVALLVWTHRLRHLGSCAGGRTAGTVEDVYLFLRPVRG